MKTIPLIGYSDTLSVRPGEEIAFKVSSMSDNPFRAELLRSISADPNPEGPGIIEEDASEYFSPREFPSRVQTICAGSYGIGRTGITVSAKRYLELDAKICVFKSFEKEQAILSVGDAILYLDAQGFASLRWRNQCVTVKQKLKIRNWYRINGRIAADGQLTIQQIPLSSAFETPRDAISRSDPLAAFNAKPVVAAALGDKGPQALFNGKIEAPKIVVDDETLAQWDFSRSISSTTGYANSGPQLDLINFPTRAMTSSDWDGSEMCWRHKPAHYAAVHFHEDDIYDFEWETDFKFKIPDNMPSGIYLMRITCGEHVDAMPFFVCPPLGKPGAKLCVLISTYTYAIYGNHARPDYDPDWQTRIKDWGAYPYNPAEYPRYGLSTYNYHSDGTGICHASHRRPLFNMRPGYLTFGNTPCSGLRHFPADSHLISWLHAKGIDYDVVTDDDLHRFGVAALEGYAAVTTGSHPEYHTGETLNALRDFRDNGGALHYLGGNGFYWRIAIHPENDSLLEIRRAEDGIRAWAAEPGEYYNAFDGTYGGLWRRNARPPQELVSVGFAAQGEFYGAPYQRVSKDPAYDWVFEGVTDTILGDFGYSGNGAAGFELDHCDARLGTPENTVILARSVTQDGEFMLVPEEQLTHLTNLSGGPASDILHADMVYTEFPNGGSVFSVGSITFCGSLPYNNYDNNISRILENMFNHALRDKKNLAK